jgi:hypothetical protein
VRCVVNLPECGQNLLEVMRVHVLYQHATERGGTAPYRLCTQPLQPGCQSACCIFLLLAFPALRRRMCNCSAENDCEAHAWPR